MPFLNQVINYALAKKNQLQPSASGIEALIGVSVQWPAYKFAHLLNQALGLELRCTDDWPVYSDKARELAEYPFYHQYHDDWRTHICVAANKSGSTLIFPDQKQLDYLIFFKGAIRMTDVRSLVKTLKTVEGVMFASLLQGAGIKVLPQVLEELELHLDDLAFRQREALQRIMPSAENQ